MGVDMIRTILSLFVVFAACDLPPGVGGSAEKKASKIEEERSNVSGDRRSLSACLDSCGAGDLSDTDRATCRLNCETAFKSSKAEVVDDDFTKATRCMQPCRGRAAAEAKTCREACRAPAATALGAPAGPALERLDQCVEACHGDATLGDDDRATCEITCAQEARRLAAAPR